MDGVSLPAVAGAAATLLFVLSALPMLVRAARTRDLASYSPANLIIANVGNLLQTGYVLSLPLGPIYAMHAFNVIVSALMLSWWLRHHWLPARRAGTDPKENEDDHPDHSGDRHRRTPARR